MALAIKSGADLTKFNEGLTLIAKPDAKGKWVIGYGHDIPPSPGLSWSIQQAEDQFSLDYPEACFQAAADIGDDEYDLLTKQRQAVLNDMAYELGGSGLSRFTIMLSHMRTGEWDSAADALRASLLFEQVPHREARNIQILTTGMWPT